MAPSPIFPSLIHLNHCLLSVFYIFTQIQMLQFCKILTRYEVEMLQIEFFGVFIIRIVPKISVWIIGSYEDNTYSSQLLDRIIQKQMNELINLIQIKFRLNSLSKYIPTRNLPIQNLQFRKKIAYIYIQYFLPRFDAILLLIFINGQVLSSLKQKIITSNNNQFMDYYLKRTAQSPINIIPDSYNQYIEQLDTYMISERHKNIFPQFDDKRRESVSKLPDIKQHCFRLVDDKPIQIQYQEHDQDYRDQQLRRRIQQYNKVMKPHREKQAKQRKSRRSDSQKRKGQKRKVRTTITQAKLDEMNRIFTIFLQIRERHKREHYDGKDYLGSQEFQKNQHNSLKSIGEKLGLGYSTILHKFRQFRATKKVKGGALIAAMHQKRKYKKSKQIEELIAQSLNSHKFYTAVQLSKYIQQTHKINLSRSIISRHLGEMGFSYKNVKSKSPNKNSNNLKECRKKVGLTLNYMKERKNSEVYYLDEYCINVKQFIGEEKLNEQSQPIEQLFVLSLTGTSGIIKFFIKNGQITEQDFEYFMEQVRELLGGKDRPQIIVLDLDEKMHHNQRMAQFREQIRRNNISLYYLPPHSHKMNLLEWLNPKIKDQLKKQQYEKVEELGVSLRKILQDLQNPCQNDLIQSSAKQAEQYTVRACNSEDF